MAFDVEYAFGDDTWQTDIPLRKPGETVGVQMVRITDRFGEYDWEGIDVRVFAPNQRGKLAPQSGFQMNDPEKVRKLADTLYAAAADLEARGIGSSDDADDDSDDDEPAVPTRPVKKMTRITPDTEAPKPRKKAAAKKAAPRKRVAKKTA